MARAAISQADAKAVKALAVRAAERSLANVSRRRLRLLARARADGLRLDRALELAARAELWLLGQADSEEIVEAVSTSTDEGDTPTTLRWRLDPELARLLGAVSAASGLAEEELRFSNRRQQALVRARHVVWWLCVTYTTRSLPMIARCFGRDHTTIMYGRRTVEDLVLKGDALTSDLVVASTTRLGLEAPADLKAALDERSRQMARAN